MKLKRLDPRTRLALGLMAIAAVFVAREPETLILESIILLAALPLLRMGKDWAHSFRYFWPMLGLVFVIAFFSFNLQVALLLAIRLFNLLTVSFVFFRTVSPEEMGATLNKLGIPYGFRVYIDHRHALRALDKAENPQHYRCSKFQGNRSQAKTKKCRQFLGIAHALVGSIFRPV